MSDMRDRENLFTNYFCLSVYTMRIARFCLEMTRSYCNRQKLKNSLYLAEKAMDSKIIDVTLKLKPESRNDILDDLQSDDLLALGNILHEIIQSPCIADIEDPIIECIKSIKKLQHEKMERQGRGSAEITG